MGGLTSRTFFVDENVTPDLARVLSGIHREHRFLTPQQCNVVGMEDVRLMSDLADRGVEAIITTDRRQLDRPSERAALREAALMHIGLPPAPAKLSGRAVLAYQVATATVGVVAILQDWPPTPSAIHLRQNWPSSTPTVEAL